MKKIILLLYCFAYLVSFAQSQITPIYSVDFEDWDVFAGDSYWSQNYDENENGKWNNLLGGNIHILGVPFGRDPYGINAFEGDRCLVFQAYDYAGMNPYINLSQQNAILEYDLTSYLTPDYDLYLTFQSKTHNHSINNPNIECSSYLEQAYMDAIAAAGAGDTYIPGYEGGYGEQSGIYFSEDGINYTKVYSFNTNNTEWKYQSVNISRLANKNNIDITSSFKMKFQFVAAKGVSSLNNCNYDVKLLIDNLAIVGQVSVHFEYDDAGNRELRKMNTIVLEQTKSSSKKKKVDEEEFTAQKLADGNVKVFPNPTKGELKVRLDGFEDTDGISLKLYSISGRLVENREVVSDLSELDMTQQAPGIYFLKLIRGDEMLEYKIIKR